MNSPNKTLIHLKDAKWDVLIFQDDSLQIMGVRIPKTNRAAKSAPRLKLTSGLLNAALSPRPPPRAQNNQTKSTSPNKHALTTDHITQNQLPPDRKGSPPRWTPTSKLSRDRPITPYMPKPHHRPESLVIQDSQFLRVLACTQIKVCSSLKRRTPGLGAQLHG